MASKKAQEAGDATQQTAEQAKQKGNQAAAGARQGKKDFVNEVKK